MSSTAKLSVQPSWSVRPMSVQQAPLVVGWIAAIDPTNEMDQNGLVESMTHEMEEALQVGISEYYIGYFGSWETFYMVGFFVEGQLAGLPAPPGGEVDYEIATLLISQDIEKGLFFPLVYHAILFIFGKDRTGRVIYQVDNSSKFLKPILLQLGFRDLGYADSACTRCWYGCRRADFWGENR